MKVNGAINCGEGNKICIKGSGITLVLCDSRQTGNLEPIDLTDGIVATMDEKEDVTVLTLENAGNGEAAYACLSLPVGVHYDMDVDIVDCQFHMMIKKCNSIKRANISLTRCRGMAKDIMINGICPAKRFKITSRGSENIHFNMEKRPSCVVEMSSPYIRKNIV